MQRPVVQPAHSDVIGLLVEKVLRYEELRVEVIEALDLSHNYAPD
jgi:hypothetical protein